MTLNFDILAGNNANWGFESFLAAPERSAAPPSPFFPSFGVTAGGEADGRTTVGAVQVPEPHAVPTPLKTVSNAAPFSDSEDNLSPMRNVSLNASVQTSDAAGRAYDSNLYVASLPEWFTDADLHDLFKRFGPIVSAKVMCHKGTHHCKGYGFVFFQNSEDAAVARSEMIGHMVGGNKIQVRRARSAASAPLTDTTPAVSFAFSDAPRSTHHSSSMNPMSYAPHLVQNHLPPFSSLYPAAAATSAPAYMLTAGHGGQGAAAPQPPTMFLAIPNGRHTVQGGGDVMYMVLAPPSQQLPSGNAIF